MYYIIFCSYPSVNIDIRAKISYVLFMKEAYLELLPVEHSFFLDLFKILYRKTLQHILFDLVSDVENFPNEYHNCNYSFSINDLLCFPSVWNNIRLDGLQSRKDPKQTRREHERGTVSLERHNALQIRVLAYFCHSCCILFSFISVYCIRKVSIRFFVSYY